MSDKSIELVRAFVHAMENFESGEALNRFFHPAIEHFEWPNRIAPKGKKRDLKEMLESSAKASVVLSSQKYDITHELVSGNRVAIEAVWTGTLKIALGTLNAGDAMHANFAMFFDVEDGKIRRISNYDCYEPW